MHGAHVQKLYMVNNHATLFFLKKRQNRGMDFIVEEVKRNYMKITTNLRQKYTTKFKS